jgi:hypothetical protein
MPRADCHFLPDHVWHITHRGMWGVSDRINKVFQPTKEDLCKRDSEYFWWRPHSLYVGRHRLILAFK